MTVQTWQESKAEAIEVEVDNIEALILAIERVDGMFRRGSEMETSLSNCRNLLSMESLNRRKAAERLSVGE